MSGERAADEGDRGGGPPGDGGIQVTELGLGDVEAAGRDRGAQLDQNRAQVYLDREGMTGPAARVMTGTAIVPARPLLP